ncbi:histidine kinase N-terminal 7TM domain-containing protein [Halocalculus aciditolerans]|uniref:histidine kinase n=1 Tax=Halocalculus aciditolerans TaxID=1383812 RepID=A0A830FAM5_9EURY|nr:histidine kinase N-terminal 7TM domain-containing protein [Halocalculus aciditolerans]GGL56063.1 hypothetical protein GCM10009039_12810 [Halocalculus aciditolerans]
MKVSLVVGILVLGAAVIDTLVGSLSLRRRPAAGATALAVLAFCTGLWVVGYGLELGAAGVAAKVFWARVQWVGVMGAMVAWLAFGLAYAGFDQYTRPRYLALIAALPVLTVALTWLNPGGVMMQDATLRAVGDLTVLVQDRGPWFLVALAYGYAAAASGMALVAYAVVASAGVYRIQALALAGALAVPTVANVAYVLGGTQTIDATPFTFTVSNALALAAIRRFDLLDARPVSRRLARDSIVEHIDDGVLVVDALNRIVDANGGAKRVLGGDDPTGDAVDTVIPDWPEIVEEGRGDVVFGTTHGGRTYDVSVGSVTDDHDRLVGRIVVFRDVTERRLQLQRLDVLNRVLRHNVRTEMNLTYGYADLIRERTTDSELADYAERIEDHALELVNVADGAQAVDRALDETRLGEVVPVHESVANAVARVRSRYPRATIRVHSVPRDVDAGAVLESIVHALVENAAEHTDAEDPIVDVEAWADDDTVTVRVLDTGPGIPEEEREVLERGRETPLEHGSGLGLWLVSWATQTLDGSVEITENDPRGTIVTVTVPRAPPEPSGPDGNAQNA